MSVSIIMPVYNAEKFLPRSIESVIHQSYRPIELILVNDGSTDSSEAICRKYALEDPRIKVLSQKNKGPAAARNRGVRQASGDFVFFLDADDFLPEKALEILIATHAVRNLIREGKTFQIPSVIQTGKKFGMQSLDDAIMEFLKKGWISGEEAYNKCIAKEKFKSYVGDLVTDFTEI